LSNDRFTLGLGSGERLNEHVIGAAWPGIAERQKRLAEAIDIIKELQSGRVTQYSGDYFRLDQARLFDPPKGNLPVIAAAGGPSAAELAAKKCDGLIATSADADIVKAYATAGGRGPRYAEIALCYARSEDEAKQTAHRYFRWSLSGWMVQPELPTTGAFAAASQHVTPEMVAEHISCGPSAELHVAAIEKYAEAGFDHLILVQIGPEQSAFCDFFARELAPRFAH
jgi:G6PDH family F420-dependent oxidoreductase